MTFLLIVLNVFLVFITSGWWLIILFVWAMLALIRRN